MRNETVPSFDAGNATARAVALAGWLAERGVRRLQIVSSTHAVEGASRRTNLPGEIVRCMPCLVAVPEAGMEFDVSPAGITARMIQPGSGEGRPA